MVYGYARVSSTSQNLRRQIEHLREYVTDERYIITDKQSGATFDRRGYNSLVGTKDCAPLLRAGDLLVIVSLDRLGRNYTEIKQQWLHITQTLKANIKVLDMPLLDTSQNTQGLDGRFVSDLVLQILSYVSEKERQFSRARQRAGIDVMPIDDNGKRVSLKTGRPTGRPAITYPEQWEHFYNQWKSGEISAKSCMESLNLKRTTFYKLVNGYKSENNSKNK